MLNRRSGRKPLLIVLVLAALTVPILGTSGQTPPTAVPPLVIAHRGGAALAPENTLAALEQAIATGADMAEVDVRATRDGVLVALHDPGLARTTGLDRPLTEVDYPILADLDAGSWFSPRFAGESIPTLEQLLTAARGRITLMVEVKDAKDVPAVVSLIRRLGMEGQCLLASTQLTALQRTKKLSPGLGTVYIGRYPPWDLEVLDYVDICSLSADTLTRLHAAQVKAQGKKLYVWTVNTPAAIRRAFTLNADGVVTDDPILASEQLRSQTEQEAA